MQTKRFTLLAGLIALAMHTGAGASPRSDSYYDYADVISAQQLYRTVRIDRPVRECWDEAVYMEDRRYNSHTPVILGGVVGGLLGHELGRKGSHGGLATAAGTVLGASIGRDARQRNRGGRYQTVERCETRHESHEEERADGYRVTYRYQGQEYVARTETDPGDRFRVRVAVSPAEK
ncbi:MAG: glycine zipper 2TM domain-containing protein [Gammaproteobacteria bacterium]|nr:glycine zipper 2TM domain-containing protein [Gammaproteobacteria bacterium]